MKVFCLIDNRSSSPEFLCEHGLSYYIEANGKKALFDTGASDSFIKNAVRMGIDLAEVDFAVISHGHNDHGGGLRAFFDCNKNAPIYIRANAFGEYYSRRTTGTAYIGLDKTLKDNARFAFTDGKPLVIAPGFALFTTQIRKEPLYSTNATLKEKRKGVLLPDRFFHEQNLAIEENGKKVLIAGCAHNGILNISDAFQILKGSAPDAVFGGFHLCNPGSGKNESEEAIARLGAKLLSAGAVCYTGHCTGTEPYLLLKKQLGDKLCSFDAGSMANI
jgi:7,8-dihydropterin-6-yl-methyl-4-(beta-D-ribofuranosyl)aminobenzene 5'-phosphate synthase